MSAAEQLTPEERLLRDQFEVDFPALVKLPPVTLELSRPQCFFLLAFLQLALQHEEARVIAPEAAQCARQVAHILEDAVAVSPALREIARRGWRGN